MTSADAQVSCNTIGDMTFCSNGQTFNRIGDMTFDNRGTAGTGSGT